MAGGIAYYMKIEGIEGESPAKNHAKEVDIITWGWGGTQAVQMGGGGISGGIVKMTDLVFTKAVDKASPKILKALVTGKPIDKVTLTCAKSGSGTTPVDFLTITMKDVMVSHFKVGGVDTVGGSGAREKGMEGTDRETEEVALAWTEVTYDYKVQDKGGGVSSAGSATYNNKTKEGS